MHRHCAMQSKLWHALLHSGSTSTTASPAGYDLLHGTQKLVHGVHVRADKHGDCIKSWFEVTLWQPHRRPVWGSVDVQRARQLVGTCPVLTKGSCSSRATPQVARFGHTG
jgi:hypothetical protein